MPNKAETFARSETHINLMRAFAGESQARNRYTIAAGMAREKNLYVVQQVFLFTADQELTHAKQFYRQLADLSGQTVRAHPRRAVRPLRRSAGAGGAVRLLRDLSVDVSELRLCGGVHHGPCQLPRVPPPSGLFRAHGDGALPLIPQTKTGAALLESRRAAPLLGRSLQYMLQRSVKVIDSLRH